MFRALSTFWPLLLLLPLAASELVETPPFAGSKRVSLDVKPIEMRTIPHAKMLRPIGGWAISSPDSDFGGLSALEVTAKGLLAVADSGVVVRFNQNWRSARIESLPSGCVPHQQKRERDSESLALDLKTDVRWVGFEHRNAICRIDADGRAVFRSPPAMVTWPKQGGPEAMVRRVDGSFLIFAERSLRGSSTAPLLLFDRDPVHIDARVIAMRYLAPSGYHPVDAAMLQDGRMLVLNRRFALPFRFSAIVMLVEPFDAKGGELIHGRPVIVLAPPHIADNFEGIAVETRGKRTYLWLASDDNFLPQQRTYILKYEVIAPVRQRRQ